MSVIFAAILSPTVFARLHPHVQTNRAIRPQSLLNIMGNGVGIDIDGTVLPGHLLGHQAIGSVRVDEAVALKVTAHHGTHQHGSGSFSLRLDDILRKMGIESGPRCARSDR